MPSIDLAFRVTGKEIPVDHGYALYAAVSHALDVVHRENGMNPGLGIHPIRGQLTGERMLRLLPEVSRLTLRLDSSVIPAALPLSGKSLILNGAPISIGIPEVRALAPAAVLRSRLVIIKGFTEPETFLQAVQRQLDALEVKGVPGLLQRAGAQALEGNAGRATEAGTPLRRTIRIRDKEVVGYAVQVSGLTADESVRLQEHGLGGRRKMGCGLFVPVRG